MSKNVKKTRYDASLDVSYDEYKQFVQTLGISNATEFNQKKSKLPKKFPRNPQPYFKLRGTWKGWGDFTGSGIFTNKKYRLYSKGKIFCKQNGIKTGEDWKNLCSSGKKPDDFPISPPYSYRKEWKGWGDFTGSGNIANQKIKFCSYEDAQKFVQSHGIKSQKYWREFKKINKLPTDIPKEPAHVYKNNGWTSWGDFLGTGYISVNKRSFLPIIDAKILARKIAKELGIDNWEKWYAAYDAGKIPKNLPRELNAYYNKPDNMEEQRKKWRKEANTRYRIKNLKEKKE